MCLLKVIPHERLLAFAVASVFKFMKFIHDSWRSTEGSNFQRRKIKVFRMLGELFCNFHAAAVNRH